RRDVSVGGVGTSFDANGSDHRVARRNRHALIRDDYRVDSEPVRGSEYDVLYITRCRVGVEPDAYRHPPMKLHQLLVKRTSSGAVGTIANGLLRGAVDVFDGEQRDRR